MDLVRRLWPRALSPGPLQSGSSEMIREIGWQAIAMLKSSWYVWTKRNVTEGFLMLICDGLIADFNHEANNTRKVLEAVPEDRLDWQPHEKSMSLGQLASHIAESPSWVHSMMEPELDFAAAGGDYQPFVASNRAELLDTFDQNVDGFVKTLSGRDDDFLSAKWTMRQGEKVLMSLPRQAAIRSTAVHHIIHHRGQLTVYLRLLGVAVPQTYGPTADDLSFI